MDLICEHGVKMALGRVKNAVKQAHDSQAGRQAKRV